MPRALIGLGATAALVAGWASLALLVHRLPPGILRDLAGFIRCCATMTGAGSVHFVAHAPA